MGYGRGARRPARGGRRHVRPGWRGLLLRKGRLFERAVLGGRRSGRLRGASGAGLSGFLGRALNGGPHAPRRNAPGIARQRFERLRHPGSSERRRIAAMERRQQPLVGIHGRRHGHPQQIAKPIAFGDG